ncbi:MAG TPA: hypothetical protein VMF12_15955, partial [Xanthobacteraceae bacterium]|nr:hypothetical protein [Xanthobacteraceae bacterium]
TSEPSRKHKFENGKKDYKDFAHSLPQGAAGLYYQLVILVVFARNPYFATNLNSKHEFQAALPWGHIESS